MFSVFISLRRGQFTGMVLTSSQNPLLQKVRRAVVDGRPLADGAIAAEGPHLLAEALRSAWKIEQIFCSSESLELHQSLLLEAKERKIETTEVADRPFKGLAHTEQTQGIVCLVRPRLFQWDELFKQAGPVVILDGIQDPGNAGAIVRSTEAFGGAGVVFTEGSVRISNGKFLSAAAGSIFRIPYLENAGRRAIVQALQEAKRPFFSLMARGEVEISALPVKESFVMVVGSEGNGVSPKLLSASKGLRIPTQGVESLNAAVACSIALFEAARQRAGWAT